MSKEKVPQFQNLAKRDSSSSQLFPDKVRKLSQGILSVLRGGGNKEGKERKRTPEQKAQQAFFQCVVESLTPEGLTAIQKFEPPHKTFDMSKLADKTVFRIRNEIVMESAGYPPLTEHIWDYFCIIRSENNFIVFQPMHVLRATDKALFFDNIYSLKTFENKSPRKIEVSQVEIKQPLLDWDNLGNTFNETAFVKGELYKVITVTLHPVSVEVVAAGEKEKERAPQTSQPLTQLQTAKSFI